MEALPASFAPVLTAVAPVADRFAAAGHRLYLVGGAVRDRLLGLPFADDGDVDCTTDADPETVHRLVAPIAEAVWLQGAAFGTVGCTVGGRAFEITTHRAEAYGSDSRKPLVAYSADVVADLSRRDFTVNAMAVSLPDGAFVDPFDGAGDLERRVLRTPIAPGVSMDDDPLRMLRAARFVAGLGLRPVPELETAVRERAARITIVSAERVHDELTRLLRLPAPGAGLHLLRATGVLDHVLPEPAGLDDARFAAVVDAVDAVPALATDRLRVLVRFLTVLCGRAPADPVAWRAELRTHVARHAAHLRWSRDERATTLALAELVPDVATHRGPWAPRELRAVLAAAARHRAPEPGIVAAAADAAIRAGGGAGGAGADFAAAAAALVGAEGADPTPPLDGRAVMDLLDVGPGPHVGRAMAALEAARVEHGPLDRAAAEVFLRAWWTEGGRLP